MKIVSIIVYSSWIGIFTPVEVISPLPDKALCEIAYSIKAIRCLLGETDLVKNCISVLKQNVSSCTTENLLLSTMFL